MTEIENLLAERAIERLIIDYGAHNDAGDWDAVVALFAPDGRMSRPTAPDDFIEGRDAILAAFKSRPARATRHICANIRVDIDSDSTSATSQILLFTGHEAPKVGSYHDKFVRTADGWRFTERLGSMDFPL
jgi:ketosteroid isomerase-like protein